MKIQLRILIVDDEQALRKSLGSILRSILPEYDLDIFEAVNGRVALQRVQEDPPYDLVLMDVKMPELDGISALQMIKNLDARTFVVILTAHSNVQDAIAAIKGGAYDYLEKPIQSEVLKNIVLKALEARAMVAGVALSNPIFDDDLETDFVGHSRQMQQVFKLIQKLTEVNSCVLIRGQRGTGKERVAKAIHYNAPKNRGHFIVIENRDQTQDELFVDLFGQEKDASHLHRKIGKFQLANNGTIFISEVGQLAKVIQSQLVQILSEGYFFPSGSQRPVKTSARLIAATTMNLEKLVVEREFSEELFYRLNVMPIYLPPLNERLDDIGDLAVSILRSLSRKHGKTIESVSPSVLSILRSYAWPGNIRELESVLETALINENGQELSVASLPQLSMGSEIELGDRAQPPLNFDVFKEEMEREFIVRALKANGGRINRTVAQANIPKNTLLRKIRRYGIQVRDFYDSPDHREF